MTTLLTFRDNIKTFCSRYDHIIGPVLRFILAIIILSMLNSQFGYIPLLENRWVVLLLAGICAFLPVEFLTILGGLIVVFQCVKVSIDAGLLALAVVLIFYCGYMRFFPKTGIIVLLVPVFYAMHLSYVLPIIFGFLVGPAAIVPVIFGIILYYYANGLEELQSVLAASTDETAVAGYQYMLSTLLDNKVMLLTFIVFACVILVTYIIYRTSFEYSWIISFFAGGFLNVVLFLVGSVTLRVEVEIIPILIGSLAGSLIALVVQFGKGIVDYQRTEFLQFEDDDYYYYVKAIPKLSVSESNKNIKRINSKTHN